MKNLWQKGASGCKRVRLSPSFLRKIIGRIAAENNRPSTQVRASVDKENLPPMLSGVLGVCRFSAAGEARERAPRGIFMNQLAGGGAHDFRLGGAQRGLRFGAAGSASGLGFANERAHTLAALAIDLLLSSAFADHFFCRSFIGHLSKPVCCLPVLLISRLKGENKLAGSSGSKN